MNGIFAHPTALVEADQVGEGTRIWAYVHVMPGARIGHNCNIGDHCFLESGACVGDNVTIKNGNMIWEGVTLEPGVFVGSHVFFGNDTYPRSPRLPQASARYQSKRNWLTPTLIKQGASLGGAAVILPGVTVGEFALVGAASVVTRDVPPYALVRGNPATVCRWVCQCGRPLQFRGKSAGCLECGLTFVQEGGAVAPQGNRL